MSVPVPSTDLQGHCSTVYDGTLYVLSPAAFQTLALKSQAQWIAGALGQQNVTSPACVTAGDGAQAALYVIGGTSDNDDYNGLQRYSFANQTWEALSPPVDVLKGRTNHGVAYLQDSQSILVYAGSQPSAPSEYSSQTFAINTMPPYNIEAFVSQAPPTALPVLQPWNSSHALMVGGTPTNTAVYTFGPDEGWMQFDTNLTAPLEISSRAILIDGTDGSKVLNVYNMTASPNTVTGVVLQDSNGHPAADGQTVGNPTASSSRKRKRDLTLQDWPDYNSTYAPTAVRDDCAVVPGSGNLAVIAAGSSDSPVALFDQSDNSWVDAAKFFDSKLQQPLQPSSTSVSASTASSTASPATPPSSGGGISPHDRTLRTLGITLGVLFGIAAAFILILMLLRWRKMRQKKEDGYVDEKQGGRMSFADRGASFMKEAGGSVNEISGPNPRNDPAGSHNSLAIIAGKFSSKRNTDSHQPRISTESTTRLVKDRNLTTAAGEPVEMIEMQDKSTPVPSSGIRPDSSTPVAVYGAHLSEKDAVREERKHRSSGWSKYFATSQPAGPNGLSHLPSAYHKQNIVSMISDGSRYSTDNAHPEPSQIPSSSFAPPLDIDFNKTIDGHRMSHVTAHNPAFSDSREDLSKPGAASLPEGQAGMIEDARRVSGQSARTMSSYNNRSTLSSNLTNDYYHDPGNTPWTPMTNSLKDPIISRPPSSQYTASIHEPRVPPRGKSAGFFPGAGTSYRPSGKVKMSHSAAPSSDWAAPVMPKTASAAPPKQPDLLKNGITIVRPMRPVETRDSAAMFSGLSVEPCRTGPSSDLAPPKAAFAKHADSRDSTVTIFPSGLESPKTEGLSSRTNTALAAPTAAFTRPPTDSRESTMTIFPSGLEPASPPAKVKTQPSNFLSYLTDDHGRGVSSVYSQSAERESTATTSLPDQPNGPSKHFSVTQDKKPVVEDMSWLNLGLASGGPNPRR